MLTNTTELPLSYLNALDIGKWSRGAAIGLLFYDFLISLDLEVDLVWTMSKTNALFYLYLINRWLPFGYYVWNTIPLNSSGIVSSKICVLYLTGDASVTLIATISVQMILQLRIYALYDRSRTVLSIMLALFTVQVLAMIALAAVTMSTLAKLPLKSTPTGCAYEGYLPTTSLFWLPGLVFEPILFLLVVVRVYSYDAMTPLLARMKQGSMYYFVAIFIQLLASTVIWARFPEYINVFNPWSAAFPSLFGSRLFLGMRNFKPERKQDLDKNAPSFETSGTAAAIGKNPNDVSHGVISTLVISGP